MGDLIMKLPTDNVVMPPEERDHFLMLFPDEETPSQTVSMPQSLPQQNIHQTSNQVQKKQERNIQKLKREVLSLVLFIAIFFILNLPFVKNLITEYIPLCSKSWIATHVVQATLFALILWLVVNSEYSRV